MDKRRWNERGVRVREIGECEGGVNCSEKFRGRWTRVEKVLV